MKEGSGRQELTRAGKTPRNRDGNLRANEVIQVIKKQHKSQGAVLGSVDDVLGEMGLSDRG